MKFQNISILLLVSLLINANSETPSEPLKNAEDIIIMTKAPAGQMANYTQFEANLNNFFELSVLTGNTYLGLENAYAVSVQLNDSKLGNSKDFSVQRVTSDVYKRLKNTYFYDKEGSGIEFPENSIINCILRPESFDFRSTAYIPIRSYEKIQHIGPVIFGMHKVDSGNYELYLIEDYGNGDTILMQTWTVGLKNFFLCQDKSSSNDGAFYLITVTESGSEQKLNLISVSLNLIGNAVFNFNKDLTINSEDEILDVQISSEKFYYLTNDTFIYNNNNKFNFIDENTNIESFLVLSNHIYTIENGQLVIRNKDMTVARTPSLLGYYILGLDYYVNPFNGNKFVGLFLDPTRSYYYYFIETYIGGGYEGNPIICKKFYNDAARKLINWLTPDYLYTYFYIRSGDTRTSIIHIRRGIIYPLRAASGKIEYTDSKPTMKLVPQKLSTELLMSAATDLIVSTSQKYVKIVPSLLESDCSNMRYFNKFNVNASLLLCSANQPGDYLISLSNIKDGCDSNSNHYCEVINNYEITVKGKTTKNVAKILFYILLAVGAAMLVIFLIQLFRKKSALNYKNAKLLNIDKNNRGQLYGVMEEEISINGKIESKRVSHEIEEGASAIYEKESKSPMTSSPFCRPNQNFKRNQVNLVDSSSSRAASSLEYTIKYEIKRKNT